MNLNCVTANALVLAGLCTAGVCAEPAQPQSAVTDAGGVKISQPVSDSSSSKPRAANTSSVQSHSVNRQGTTSSTGGSSKTVPNGSLPTVNSKTTVEGYYEHVVPNQPSRQNKQYVASPDGRSFSLRESIDVAMRQNASVKVADEKIVAAHARYEQSKSAKNLQFNVANKTTWQNRQTSGNVVSLNGLTDQLSASLSALLTTFGRVENEVAAAYLDIGVEALNAAETKHELAYEVKEAFFERLKADASVDVAVENLKVSKQSLADSEKMYARGVMAWYDVVQADLTVTEGDEQLARAYNSVSVADANFLRLLAVRVPAGVSPTLIEPQPVEVDPACTLEQLQNVAMVRRFEILSIDRSMEAILRTRDAVKYQNRPEVKLSADYIFSPGYRTYPSSMYQLNLNVSWAAWDGGSRLAQLDELDSQIRSLQASRDDLCDSVRLAVEKAYLQFSLTEVTLNTAMKRVDAAWVYYNMARQRFLNGMGTSLEVQNALVSLNSARQDFVVATYDRDLAFANIEYCVGADFPGRRLAVTPDMLRPLDDSRE